jgi:hypothetical protein
VLIDLEGHRPVALPPDREAETLAEGLQAHPGIAAVARGRSKAYASGLRQGAPAATQAADRFHLLQNLAEALEQVFSRPSAALKAAHEAMRQAGVFPTRRGCRHAGPGAIHFFGELKGHGYPGSYVTVARYARRLREAQGLALWQRRGEQPLPVVADAVHPPLTVG